MVAVDRMIFMFGGAYQQNNAHTDDTYAADYAENSLYVLVTFEERLFLPRWLDLSEFSHMPSLQHPAAAAVARSVWIQVRLAETYQVFILYCLCACKKDIHE